MGKSLAATLVLSTALAGYVSAGSPPPYCQCIWEGGFLEAYPKADLVVSGTITRIKGNSLDFIIDETLLETPKGKSFFPDIRIWAAYKGTCRPDIKTFTAHDDWVFALYRITNTPKSGFNPNTPSQSYGREQDYYLSACGSYWLEKHEARVSGNLLQKERWLYSDDEMNPVFESLLIQYIQGQVDITAIAEAAKPQQDSIKALMNKTLDFVWE